MRRVEALGRCALPPERALALWSDPRRWPTFVEGFQGVVEQDQNWPEAGSRLVWTSIPSGRGRVTEKVRDRDARRLETEVFEEALHGRQSVTFRHARVGEGQTPHTLVELALEYELPDTSLARRIADRLFIRRALRDAQVRTVRRFCVEADEEAALG